MLFQFGLRSSLLLIFFTHLLVYSVLCWRRSIREDNQSDRFLGTFLFLSALFIMPWMTGFAGWYDTQPYRDILFYLPCIHGLFFGPLLFLYVKTITNYKYQRTGKDLLHFIPGAIYLLWTFIVIIVDKVFAHRYLLMNGENDPDFDAWYSYTWLVSLGIYLLISIHYYRVYVRFIPFEVSFAELARFKWLRNFLYSFMLLTICSVVIRILSVFVDLGYWSTWYYYLSYAIIVYYIAIAGYMADRTSSRSLQFEPQLFLEYIRTAGYLEYREDSFPEEAVVVEGDEKKEESNPEMEEWRRKLEQLMEEEKLYLLPELTLSDVAKKLKTNASFLSKIINRSFALNFNDYINRQRVEEVVRKMNDPACRNQKLISLAYDGGFNSKSTFNRAFQKFMGQTPKEYFEKNN